MTLVQILALAQERIRSGQLFALPTLSGHSYYCLHFATGTSVAVCSASCWSNWVSTAMR